MTSPIVTERVKTRHDLNTFISLPGLLYKDDPHWVEPLHMERREHLSSKNPTSLHVTWQAWVAKRGNVPVGRIMAQIDTLHREIHGNGSGHFGMLDAIDDPEVVHSLISTAEAWLREQGAQQITGPFSLNINQESGLLVEGFDTPPSVFMNHNPAYLEKHLTAARYTPAMDLLAYWMRTDELNFPAPLRRMMDRERGRIRIRPLDRSQFEAEMQTLRSIFNDAWAKNWGFVPFTEKEFSEMGAQMKLLVPEDLIYIAEIDNQPCAFIVAMPNLQEAIAPLKGRLLPFGWLRLLWKLKVSGTRTARVPLMGVRQHYQFSRQGPVLALLLIEALKQPFVRRKIDALEMSWILETNTGMRTILERIGATAYKRYRLYEKHI
ncbi:N-acetyltransferase [Pseudomonas typographi]|uniref:N-acetyltransferase n=1 Tax=Pseudomonas typographi TaxID=2715964 RepID=A0ABR7Z8H2_9PSED|nr:N-acetyltransferase [Pseudomonas typographi]MBD1552066.1 N-acetyltransferase [Pseudomonas typographi]MBD1601782.1 N-acetyltransferase [Pseudomonas typographi]